MKKEETPNSNNFGIASVVFGIIGAVSGIFVLPIVFSIIGLIFGIIQYKNKKNRWAIWGIALSLLGIIIAIYAVIKIIAVVAGVQQTIELCQSNPLAPGCADLLKFAGDQTP